jgi:non-heme chloroperoxidase
MSTSIRIRCLRSLARVLLIAGLTGAAVCVAAPPQWRDPSPHAIRFIAVDRDVRLEVLDWGGQGRPVILLSGLGFTAHVFDDFAPRLAKSFHVMGITRRGFGQSSAPAAGYSADRLGEDVLAVMHALNLHRPVLAGHSIAGEELSSIGSRHPEEVAGLVYLDALMLYSFDDGKSGVTEQDLAEPFRKLPGVPPTAAERASPGGLQQWQLRASGVLIPESEFHYWAPHASPAMQAVVHGEARYDHITVPILALCSDPQEMGSAIEGSQDPQILEARDRLRVIREKLLVEFERALPNAHMIRIPAPHFVFISDEPEVLDEMRKFIGALPP